MFTNFRSVASLAIGIVFVLSFIAACSGGSGDSVSSTVDTAIPRQLVGTWSSEDISVITDKGAHDIEDFEKFDVTLTIDSEGYAESTGCIKYVGEPEVCSVESGWIESKDIDQWIMHITNEDCKDYEETWQSDGKILTVTTHWGACGYPMEITIKYRKTSTRVNSEAMSTETDNYLDERLIFEVMKDKIE